MARVASLVLGVLLSLGIPGSGTRSADAAPSAEPTTKVPPRIFLVLPSGAAHGQPVLIVGSHFGRGAIPYVNSVPSIAVLSWSIKNIPLIGSIAVGVTIVPQAAPRGPGDIVLDYAARRSNAFPFTVR